MKGSTRAATAIGIGYILGRRRKLKAAAMLAAATAAGSTPIGGLVLRRGAKLVGPALSSVGGKLPPGVNDIIDVVRGDLLPAGKAAVTAAATSRVDTLTDSLHERAERVRDPGAVVSDAADKASDVTDKASGTAGKAPGAAGKASSGAVDEASGLAGKARRRTRPSRASEDTEPEPPRDETDELEDVEDVDDEPYEADESDEEPVTRVRRTNTRRRATVTRARR